MGHCHPWLCRWVLTFGMSTVVWPELTRLTHRSQVTGLRASTDNRASTVLSVFLEAVQAYGMPSRMRGDRGGENKDVSVFMIMTNGPNRASFMWGS
jgi:hypothetical protein